jgi:hypothetical protein
MKKKGGIGCIGLLARTAIKNNQTNRETKSQTAGILWYAEENNDPSTLPFLEFMALAAASEALSQPPVP